jgi:hypothetical protein
MWQIPDTFEVLPIERASFIPSPIFDNEQELKTQFGIELGKANQQPFQAASAICGQDISKALWISRNWINDPIVLAAKDSYTDSLKCAQSLLDKEQTAAKLLKMAEEMNASNTFYLLDGKDRLKALELYAKIQGFLDSKDSKGKTFNNNTMIVKFVEAENDKPKPIIENEEIINADITPLKVKLIG